MTMTEPRINPTCLICKEEIGPHEATVTCPKCGNVYHQHHNEPCPYHSTPVLSKSGACLGISLSFGMMLFLGFILLAGILIFAATGGVFAQPYLSNIYMASNSDGDAQNGSYSPSQDFFVFFDLNNASQPVTVEVRWYSVDVPGYASDTLFSKSEGRYTDAQIYFQVYFQDESTWWLPGKYRVDIYVENRLKASKIFYVE